MPSRVLRRLDVSRSAMIVRCGMGAMIATAALLFRMALDPLVGDQVPFAVALAATVLATWIAGIAGGTTNVIVSAVLVDFTIVPPRFKFSPIEHAAAEAVFLVVGFTLVWQVGRLRRAEVALRESEANARAREAEIASIYDSAPIGLCIFDCEGRYVRINRRLAEINGAPPEQHIGRTFDEVVPGIAGAARDLLQQVIASGKPATDVEIQGEVPSAPGVVRTWSENWFPVRDESGRVVGVNVAVQEISERKRVEEELRQANQVKDEFLATLSHELRTPLNAILGWAQILARGGVDERLAKQAIDTIFRNAQAQTRLVTDVLDGSRMISGKLRLELQDVDLVPVLRDAVESIRPAANAKRLVLKIVTEMKPLIIRADASRMQQVFWNLLSNAVKFSDPGGRVTVELQQQDSNILLTVRDTGIGMRPEFVPRVFERFTQADSSPSRQHSGLGLGLSIVRHLVELHGGTVTAASGGPGHGSEFTVSLPALARRPTRTDGVSGSAANAMAPARERDVAPGLHVLVLDDVADARALVAAILEREGVRVSVAASAHDALERVAALRPDIVLADIGMPNVDGFQFLRTLRELPLEHGGSTPVIAVTAYGSEADREKMLAAGFLAHLPKPIDPDRLLATLSLARSAGNA